jgi:hypothetical protein
VPFGLEQFHSVYLSEKPLAAAATEIQAALATPPTVDSLKRRNSGISVALLRKFGVNRDKFAVLSRCCRLRLAGNLEPRQP